jgi:hypothetical protein
MDTYGPIGYTYNKCSYCEDCLPDDVLLRRYLGVVVKMIPLFPWTKGEFPCEACGFVLPTDLPAETFERWRELGRERARGFDVEGILRDRYTVERTPEDVLREAEEGERRLFPEGHTNTQHAINQYGMTAAKIQHAFDAGLWEVFDAQIARLRADGEGEYVIFGTTKETRALKEAHAAHEALREAWQREEEARRLLEEAEAHVWPTEYDYDLAKAVARSEGVPESLLKELQRDREDAAESPVYLLRACDSHGDVMCELRSFPDTQASSAMQAYLYCRSREDRRYYRRMNMPEERSQDVPNVWLTTTAEAVAKRCSFVELIRRDGDAEIRLDAYDVSSSDPEGEAEYAREMAREIGMLHGADAYNDAMGFGNDE